MITGAETQGVMHGKNREKNTLDQDITTEDNVRGKVYVHVGGNVNPETICPMIIELPFVFVEAVFVAPRSEELGIAT